MTTIHSNSKLGQGSTRPLMRVSYNAKIEDNFKYCQQWMEYCINSSRFSGTTFTGSNSNRKFKDRNQLRKLYDLAENKLDETWFAKLTNPYNAKNAANKNFPASIEFYNLLYSNYRLLMGEKDDFILDFMVINKTPESESLKLKNLLKASQENLRQQYINELNLQGVDTGRDTQEIEPLENVIEKFNREYRDELSIQGQLTLEYIVQFNRMHEVFLDMFKDWLVAGESYIFSEERHEEVISERVPVFEIDYAKTPNSKFIEDADWVVRRMEMTQNEILDKFWHLIDDDELKQIDERYNATATPYYYVFNEHYRSEKEVDRLTRTERIVVYHCQWRTYRKVGILTYPNKFGEFIKRQVDETFKLTREDKQLGATLEFIWVNEVWEGYLVDERFYLGFRPLPYQMNELGNLAESKLSYNGRSTDVSMFELGLPWQKLWIIIWYRLEMAIAKSKGTIGVLPIQAVPSGEGKEGWDKEQFLYASEALGLMLVDLQQDGLEGQTLNNLLGKIDMNQLGDASFYIDLLEYIKVNWDNTLGITPGRKGAQKASATVGGLQSELEQSNAITSLIFSEFEQIEERALTQQLNLSKYAFLSGKKAMLVRDDLSQTYLDLNPEKHIAADYGVFVTKSRKEKRNLEVLKQAGINLASQGNKPSIIAEIAQATNIAKVTAVLKQIEDKDAELQAQIQQAEIQAQKEKDQSDKDFEMLKMETEAQSKQLDNEFEILKMEIQHNNNLELERLKQGTTIDIDNTIKDENDRLALNMNERMKVREQALAERKQNIDSRIELLKIQQKDEDSKRKAETALKNKVVGEN
jgi:hypothetical protein